MYNPLVSLVLPTKNSMPHLKAAINGIRHQTYRNFELIVQDGGSTDGTLEYLYSVEDLPKIEIVSEPDSGIGQAYNRGITRSKGDLLCLTASDEFLFDRSLEMGVSWFRENPSAAAIYGGMALVDKYGREQSKFIPRPFDFLEFMRCDLFPTTAGLLNKKVIGEDLFYDESLKSCPDYDFWLRLGSRFSRNEIINHKELFMAARGDSTSMSYRPESFEQFHKDKIFVLERFLNGRGKECAIEALKNWAKIGILMWAADGIMGLKGDQSEAIKLFKKVAEIDPRARRFWDFLHYWRIKEQPLRETVDKNVPLHPLIKIDMKLRNIITRILRSKTFRKAHAFFHGRPRQSWIPK